MSLNDADNRKYMVAVQISKATEVDMIRPGKTSLICSLIE